jgi:CelD/BcsL family acetyltransferase involved in cellulose biosynthesis
MTLLTQAAAVSPHPVVHDLRVEVLDTPWGFTALRPHWNALLRSSASDSPFLTWEWLHSWCTHLAGSAMVKLVAVRDGAELIAVAPFCVVPGRLPWFSQIALMGTGCAGSDYLDLIAQAGREGEAISAIAGYLNAQQTTVRLDRLPDASVAERLATRLTADGWVVTSAPDGVCPVIPLAGHTWDSYLATLGSAHRANVRRRLRGIEQQFRVRFDLVTSDGDRMAALDSLARFHQRRFQPRGGSTAFHTPAVRAFQDEATRRALDRGWLRMYVLRLDDEIAAVMYGLLYGRTFYFYQHGFDDRFSRHSIGLVLMAHTVRAAIDNGAATFDLLWGTEAYKSLWAREHNTLRRIHLFPPHAAGMIHRRVLEARRRLGRLARRVLPSGEHRVPRT